jgi:hypothetical protein
MPAAEKAAAGKTQSGKQKGQVKNMATVDYESEKITINPSAPSPIVSPAVVVTFTYEDLVGLDPNDLPDVTVAISNLAVDPIRVHLSADRTEFIVTIDADMGYPMVTNALITVDAKEMEKVSIGSGGDEANDFTLSTVIPLGPTVSLTGEGDNPVSVDVLASPQINGMIHVGLYQSVDNDPFSPLTPLWATGVSDTDPIQVKTYTVFVDGYNNMTPERVAAAIVSSVGSDPAFTGLTDYTISSNAATVELEYTGAGDAYLYIYIFDDDLINAVNKRLIDDGQTPITLANLQVKPDEGVLPVVPDYS